MYRKIKAGVDKFTRKFNKKSKSLRVINHPKNSSTISGSSTTNINVTAPTPRSNQLGSHDQLATNGQAIAEASELSPTGPPQGLYTAKIPEDESDRKPSGEICNPSRRSSPSIVLPEPSKDEYESGKIKILSTPYDTLDDSASDVQGINSPPTLTYEIESSNLSASNIAAAGTLPSDVLVSSNLNARDIASTPTLTHETLVSSGLNAPPITPARPITDAGLTTCGDGGRTSEIEFLKEHAELIRPRIFNTSKSLLNDVRNELNKAKVENAMNPVRDFIPCTSLHQIITYDTVRLLLPHCDESLDKREVEPYARRIASDDNGFTSSSFRRIFAILIILKIPETVFEFIAREFDDAQLPVYANRTDAHIPDIFCDNPLWDPQDIKDFCRVQWEVSPVFFSVLGNRTVHYDCRPGEILPLMPHEWRLDKRGGYGEVACYALHPHQQNLKRYTKDGAGRPIAVKKLYRANNKEEFDQEHYMLDRLTHSLEKCAHLAKLLLTYEVPKSGSNIGPRDYFLVFECADSNLSDLWVSPAPDEMSAPRRSEWVASQALGLAEALSGIHRFELNRKSDDWNPRTHGFHGDLKPDNILLYHGWENQDHELGILQITDFGLSSFHNTQTVENINFNTQAGDYRPPEAQLVLNVSNSLDVWALGCISLEFLTWLVMGPKGLEEFEKRRRASRGFFSSSHTCFWEVTEEGDETTVSLGRSVIDHTTELCRSPRSSDFVRALCEIIINNMLVIEDKGMNSQRSNDVTEPKPTPVKRINAFDLEMELKKLVNQDISYYTPSPCPDYPSFYRTRHCIRVGKTLHVLVEEATARYMENKHIQIP